MIYPQHYRCYNCDHPLPPTVHIHHKIHVADGGKNTLDDLIALCPNCHAEHHQEQLKDAEKKQCGDDYEDDEQDGEGNSETDMVGRLNKFGEDL